MEGRVMKSYKEVRENKKCRYGELNPITKEIFCTASDEFCKFIEFCKYNPFVSEKKSK